MWRVGAAVPPNSLFAIAPVPGLKQPRSSSDFSLGSRPFSLAWINYGEAEAQGQRVLDIAHLFSPCLCVRSLQFATLLAC